MLTKKYRFLFGNLLCLCLVFFMTVPALAATSITVSNFSMSYEKKEEIISLSDGEPSTDGGGTEVTFNENKFTITATNSKKYTNGVLFWETTYYAQDYKATLKLTNTSGTTLTVTYKTENINGVTDGTYTKTMLNGDSLSFEVISQAESSTTTTATTITGYLTLESVTAVTNAEVRFDSAVHGSYTYTVDEKTAEVSANAETSEPYSVTVGSSVTLTAGAADSGYTFYGWAAGDRLLGTASGEYTIEDSMTVYPIFLKTEEMNKGNVFQVGNNTYMLWSHAFADAESTGNTVVLLRSHDLPTTLGDNGLKTSGTYVTADSNGKVTYIIPENTEFVVPYSGTDTGDFDGTPDAKGASANSASIGTRSAFRTLTVNDGVTISCEGSMNLNAQQFATSNNTPGCVMGQYGHLELNGANAKLNVSGNLYCYGYITGSGSVEIISGGKLYELMQLMDWRGGNAASSAITQDLFPFSQYFVQNVETYLIVNSGATSYVCVAIEAGTPKRVYQITPEYIGSAGFFQLGSGAKIIREYDTAKDLINYTISGGSGTLSGMELSLGDYKMNTANYVFAITPNMSLTVADTADLTLVEYYKLLPNVKVVIDGTATVDGDLYIYDYADWMTGTYAYNGNYYRVNYIATNGKGSSRSLAEESASVTVNGTLTVTGGMYTTSGNSSADKVLKGTGKLINTPSSTSVATVREGTMNTSGWLAKTDIHYINVSPVLGNLVNVGTLQTFGSDTYYGGYGADGSGTGNYWSTGAVASFGGEKAGKHRDLSTALTENPDANYYQMQHNSTESNIDATGKTIYIDLNGKTVKLGDDGKGTLTANLYGMDSSGNGFGNPTGSIVGNMTVAPVASHTLGGTTEKHYVPIQTSAGDITTTQFHRVAPSISTVQFYLVQEEGNTQRTAYLTMEGVCRSTAAGLTALDDLGFRIINQTTDANGQTVDVNDDQMYVADGKDKDGNRYTISTIKTNLTDGAVTEPIYYTCAVDLTSDIQSRMLFNGEEVLGAKHVDILSTILELAKEQFAEGTKERTAIDAYIGGGTG